MLHQMPGAAHHNGALHPYDRPLHFFLAIQRALRYAFEASFSQLMEAESAKYGESDLTIF